MARSRLRAARAIQRHPQQEYLYILVTVSGPAFSLDTEYQKLLEDPGSGIRGHAAAWERGSVGTYGSSGANYIMSSLSRVIDEFIDEYLRVNADAC